MISPLTRHIVARGFLSPDWTDSAACKGQFHIFFSPNRAIAAAGAKAICAACPVRNQCLASALLEEGSLDRNDRAGVRGGMAPRERHVAALSLGLRGDGRQHSYRLPA